MNHIEPDLQIHLSRVPHQGLYPLQIQGGLLVRSPKLKEMMPERTENLVMIAYPLFGTQVVAYSATALKDQGWNTLEGKSNGIEKGIKFSKKLPIR